MNNEVPPQYFPQPPGGPSAPGYPAGFSSQPAAFPGAPYQTYPQAYTGGGDHYPFPAPSGPPGPQGPLGPYLNQPGYQGYQGYQREQPKTTVFVADPNHGINRGGDSKSSCLAGCLAAMCCCFLLDIF
ncbi:uncharacterized protein LOC144513477 [Sander vitreus]